jgi:hypothetical protein
MSRRTPTPQTQASDETDAPLVPDLGTRTGRTATTTNASTRSDRAERRSRRDPFEIALMEDSE